MSIRVIIPFIIFILIFFLLWRGLSLHPAQVPSPLINKKAPSFQLINLLDQKKITGNQDFLGHVTLLNVWATWCSACAQEHDFLMQLSQKEKITFFGLNYKDDPAAAKKWLQENGNPYQLIGVDREGSVGIDWGVYGTPETFIIDKKGVIRYKQIGPITPEVWNQELKFKINELLNEPA